MRRLGLFLLMVATLASPAAAQQPLLPRPGVFLSFFAGGTAYSDFQRQRSRWTDESAAIGWRNVEHRISAEEGASFGAAISYWPSAQWGFRLHASIAPSEFEFGRMDAERSSVGTALGANPAGSADRITISSYDLDVLLPFPIPTTRFAPFAILGVGAVHYAPRPSSDGSGPGFASAFRGSSRTRLAGVVGIGALVPLSGSDFALTFELTDHFARTPVAPEGFDALIDNPAAQLASDAEGDRTVKVVSNLQFVVGFTVASPFGRRSRGGEER